MEYKFILSLAVANIFGSIAFSYSQPIEGKITDYDTGLPLSYVNVGIPGKAIGTVSNTEGIFKLVLSNELDRDTIVCSLIGYNTEKKLVYEIRSQGVVQFRLKPRTYHLQEVVVSSRKYKSETLGNQDKSSRRKIGIGRDQLGAELGTLIQLGSKPAYLETASFYIAKNDYGKIRLRLNIYAFTLVRLNN